MKAQVLSGGRGLGTFPSGCPGVTTATQPGEARECASKMLGRKLVTKQARQGIICNRVLLMERYELVREMYVSIVLDRASQGPLLVASPRAGSSIEEVAQDNPESIYTEDIDIMEGLQEDQCKRMAKNLGLEEGTKSFSQAEKLMLNLYTMFSSCDCTQVEVNPLAETPEGNIVVCDAKVNFDDNAEFRQSSIFEKRDASQEDPREVEAADHDLNYIGLDGNIGCMVNGGSY